MSSILMWLSVLIVWLGLFVVNLVIASADDVRECPIRALAQTDGNCQRAKLARAVLPVAEDDTWRRSGALVEH
jgi:hypothetical protein